MSSLTKDIVNNEVSWDKARSVMTWGAMSE